MNQVGKKKTSLVDEIRPEAKAAYQKLKPNIQEMYRGEMCFKCRAHLTRRQLNRIIIEGVPPLCLKCYKDMQSEMAKLAPLFDQLSLF